MFSFLRQSGTLKKTKGLLLGQFTDLTDTGRPFGMSLQDIVMHHMEGIDVPIVFNLPFGHEKKMPFFPLPIGQNVTLDTSKSLVIC